MSDSLKQWTVSWLTLDCLWTTKRSRRPLTTSRFQPRASGERRWLSRLGERRDLPGLIFFCDGRDVCVNVAFSSAFTTNNPSLSQPSFPLPTLSHSLCLPVCLSFCQLLFQSTCLFVSRASRRTGAPLCRQGDNSVSVGVVFTWLDVTVSCSALPRCAVLDGTAGWGGGRGGL